MLHLLSGHSRAERFGLEKRDWSLAERPNERGVVRD
jgi:hypothetical protein